MKKGNISTQELLGVKSFSRNGIQTDGHGELVYFMITPTNISVLSRVSIGQKVHHLMQLLSAQPDIEIVCTDARENFDDNKLYLDDRAENEPNKKVRDLLLRDKAFLDDIQLQMSTAREFMFAYRLTHESEDGALATLNRIEKHISDQGFEVKRANKEDIKRFLSRYFGHMVEDSIDDVDGERMIKKWIIPD